ERGASAAAQAPHVARSAEVGDAGAVGVLVAAASASDQRAPALAGRWYGDALHLLPDGPDTASQRVQLLMAQALALSGAGQLSDSRESLLEALDIVPPDAPERVMGVAFCAGVEHLLGRHRDADARLAAALDGLAHGTSPDAVQLQLELAAGAGYQNREEAMLTWAETALAGALELGARSFEAAA